MICIKNITFLQPQKGRFLSAAKLLLFCQVDNSFSYEKIYDFYGLFRQVHHFMM